MRLSPQLGGWHRGAGAGTGEVFVAAVMAAGGTCRPRSWPKGLERRQPFPEGLKTQPGAEVQLYRLLVENPPLPQFPPLKHGLM